MDLAHAHSFSEDEHACPECGGHTYQIEIRKGGPWCAVGAYIFRSWTGRRKLDGEEYEGPVYYLGSREAV